MKTHPLFLALCLSTVASAADFAAWTHHQTVRITQPGLTRTELEPALLDASRTSGGASFHDLRVISPTGIETPYIVVLPRLIQPEYLDASVFKATLNPRTTVLEFQSPTRDTISEVLLQTNASIFIKAATLDASKDGTNWQPLASNELICRQNGTERLHFVFAPDAWAHFRVSIDDTRTTPIAFTGAQIRRDLPELRTLDQPVTIRARREIKNETHLTLDLGTANSLLGQVHLHTPEPVFQREVTLLNTQATLFRLQHEGSSAEYLDVAVHQLATIREVELIIRNGDSPPLRIDSIEATRHPVPIVFQADATGDWQLFIGNAQAAAPRYDIAALSDKLRDATANSATTSAIEANTAFRKTATAPEVGETGAALDISAWSFQKAVQFKEAGVVELELDPAVLARSTNDLRDLRILRDGHQIPFIVTKPGLKHEVEVPFAEMPDSKTPTLSKWDISLPFPNFPATELLLDSPTPLFMRTLSVNEQHDSEQGHLERHLGSENWQRKPGQSTNSFRLALYTTPKSPTIQLTTDNGDNAPLKLTSVRAVYPVVRLLFRVPDTAPVHLCYGNQRATLAHYDLQLVRQEFETATKVAASLGNEQKLSGDQADRLQRGKSSPWLWTALALVVGALLWIMAKMMPPQPAA